MTYFNLIVTYFNLNVTYFNLRVKGVVRVPRRYFTGETVLPRVTSGVNLKEIERYAEVPRFSWNYS